MVGKKSCHIRLDWWYKYIQGCSYSASDVFACRNKNGTWRLNFIYMAAIHPLVGHSASSTPTRYRTRSAAMRFDFVQDFLRRLHSSTLLCQMLLGRPNSLAIFGEWVPLYGLFSKLLSPRNVWPSDHIAHGWLAWVPAKVFVQIVSVTDWIFWLYFNQLFNSHF